MQMRESERQRRSIPMRGLIAAFVSFALVAGGVMPAGAEVTLEEYRRMKSAAEQGDRPSLLVMVSILGGVMDGIEEVNAAHRERGEKPLLCLPLNPRPTIREMMAALEDEFQAQRGFWTDNRYLGHAATEALRRKWPCK